MSIALSPGFMRTELVLANMGVTEATYRQREALHRSESPHYLGRAVVALARDPAILDRTGEVLMVADLARQWGFTDVDGTQPEAFHVASPSAHGERFLLLVHSDEQRWHEMRDDVPDSDMHAHAALIDELTASGALLDCSPLRRPGDGREVRVRDGQIDVRPSAVVDDPIAGYYVITAADLGEVTQIASRIPDAASHHVTIRPLLTLPGIGARPATQRSRLATAIHRSDRQ